jgi:hypothetical protein
MSTKNEPLTEPFDQISRVVKQVSDALHEASTKTANSNRHITERVMQQAEDNARQLFDTLQTMASTRNPSDIARIYTDFLANRRRSTPVSFLKLDRSWQRPAAILGVLLMRQSRRWRQQSGAKRGKARLLKCPSVATSQLRPSPASLCSRGRPI